MFPINFQYLFCQPCIYTKACSSAQSTSESSFLSSNQYSYNPSHTSFNLSISFNNFGIQLKDFEDFKSVYKNKNISNEDLLMVSIEGQIFSNNCLKNSLPSKISTFHKVNFPRDNDIHLSAAEKLIQRYEGEKSSYSCEGGKGGKNESDKKETDEKIPSLETLLTVQQHLNENVILF